MTLLERVQTHLTDAKRKGRISSLPPPASPIETAAAEARIGFPLPHTMKNFYNQIANGGFGPMGGFLGVPSAGALTDWNLVQAYELLSGNPYYHGGAWPSRLLPAIDCGHEVFFCVDCSHPAYRMIRLDVDNACLEESDFGDHDREHWPFPLHPCRRMYRLAAPSLEQFVASWLEDEECSSRDDDRLTGRDLARFAKRLASTAAR